MKPNPILVLAALAFGMIACTTTDTKKIGEAVTTPLRDLNIVKHTIPPILEQAKNSPYGVSSTADCAAINGELMALDEVLDDDAPAKADNALDRGVNRAKESVVDKVKEGVSATVPFRNWLRKLSGAERQEARVAAAIGAGERRRSFLLGLRVGKGCPPQN